jgi:ABC-2 type transport system ATP-binding protein
MAPVLAARDLVKRWGTTVALAGTTVDVGEGVTGLLGANGAGKTTLLGLMLGLTPPDSGHLEVLGLDPTVDGPTLRARIGYSPEHQLLPADTRANDLVGHLAEVHGLPHREATARASDALFLVGLGEERFRAVGTLSTGQRQRVKIAAAVAHDPELLLLDEPTDGLDPMQREEVLSLIRRIGTEMGKQVLLSSHLLDEVERICDAVVILGEGRVVASGPLEELRAAVGGWIVEVEDRGDLLASWLAAQGLRVSTDGGRIHVEGTPSAAPIRDAVASLDLSLVRLQRQRLSLEEVFLGAGAYGGPVPEGPR